MRRTVAYPLLALGFTASTLVVASPALAHGYVSDPPSRQANCASGAVKDCGPIQFEPQSVEGPKGLRSCDGGLGQFSVLADESRAWPAKAVGSTVSFNWVLTARHRTTTWEYFIGGTRVAVFDDGNTQPNATVTHSVDLSRFPGKQKVLAVWNIGDTPMAFYNCIDLNVGGGGGSPAPGTPSAGPSGPPAGTPTTAPTTVPPTAPPTAPTTAPTTAPPVTPPTGDGQPGTGWDAGVAYRTGDIVTFNGTRYQCRQGHTSLRSWEPAIFTRALWLPL
jgi:chitin-binding protein